MSRINVLSIDGGGIRGIIPASILAALEQGVGRALHEVFDLIAGTSTGGIIALGIGTTANGGKPYRPADLVGLYLQNGPAIFKKDLLTPVKSFFGPKYSPDALERTLERFFGDTRLDSALTPLLVSSYDLATQLPYFFKSHKIAQGPSYNWKARQIARATSAAPTFFPPFRLEGDGKEHALVDGGIFVNNPAMAVYAEARNLYPDASEIFLVSVGTGDRDDRITYGKAKGWGLIGWARQIIPVMMDSVSEAVDYELDAVLGAAATRQHFRLQPRLTMASNEIDDTSPENLNHLKREAEEFLQKDAPKTQTICAELRSGRGSNMPGVGVAPSPTTHAAAEGHRA
jgi:patatin-like phospholipase/acyl hydrolase